MQQPPPHQHPPPVAPQTAYPYHSFEPKLNTRSMGQSAIGSERGISKPPSSSPWDLTSLYDSLGTPDYSGYLGGSGSTSGGGMGPTSVSANMQQNFDTTFNGGLPPQSHGQGDYLGGGGTPGIGLSPNITPSKSDYGDYLGNQMGTSGSMMHPGVPNASGKKMQGFLDPPPMGPGSMGLAGRGDPASVRRNMNQSWGKKWGDD